jgi:hypothetical protein
MRQRATRWPGRSGGIGAPGIAPRHWFPLAALVLLVAGCATGGAAGPVSPASSGSAMSSSTTGLDYGSSGSGGY